MQNNHELMADLLSWTLHTYICEVYHTHKHPGGTEMFTLSLTWHCVMMLLSLSLWGRGWGDASLVMANRQVSDSEEELDTGEVRQWVCCHAQLHHSHTHTHTHIHPPNTHTLTTHIYTHLQHTYDTHTHNIHTHTHSQHTCLASFPGSSHL